LKFENVTNLGILGLFLMDTIPTTTIVPCTVLTC